MLNQYSNFLIFALTNGIVFIISSILIFNCNEILLHHIWCCCLISPFNVYFQEMNYSFINVTFFLWTVNRKCFVWMMKVNQYCEIISCHIWILLEILWLSYWRNCASKALDHQLKRYIIILFADDVFYKSIVYMHPCTYCIASIWEKKGIRFGRWILIIETHEIKWIKAFSHIHW